MLGVVDYSSDDELVYDIPPSLPEVTDSAPAATFQPTSTAPSLPASGVNVFCQMCAKELAKYRCPACALRSCSAVCAARHKVARGCNGRRDPAAAVPAAALGEAVLQSDYAFLEDVARAAGAARRAAAGGLGTMLAPGGALPLLPPARHLLLRAARARGVNLRLLPPGMTRAADNTSAWFAPPPLGGLNGAGKRRRAGTMTAIAAAPESTKVPVEVPPAYRPDESPVQSGTSQTEVVLVSDAPVEAPKHSVDATTDEPGGDSFARISPPLDAIAATAEKASAAVEITVSTSIGGGSVDGTSSFGAGAGTIDSCIGSGADVTAVEIGRAPAATAARALPGADGLLCWRLQLDFAQADPPLSLSVPAMPESARLTDLLSALLADDCAELASGGTALPAWLLHGRGAGTPAPAAAERRALEATARLLAEASASSRLRHSLRAYRAAPLAALRLLLRHPFAQAGRAVYAAAAPTLRETLRGRAVVEFPSLVVALPAAGGSSGGTSGEGGENNEDSFPLCAAPVLPEELRTQAAAGSGGRRGVSFGRGFGRGGGGDSGYMRGRGRGGASFGGRGGGGGSFRGDSRGRGFTRYRGTGRGRGRPA